MKVKILDENFREAKQSSDACYGIFENGDIELYTPYDTAYPVITREEILKLAEILKEEKMSGKSEEIDLKDKYQRRAEKLALSEYNKEIEDLDEDTQFEIYNRAEVLVGEELQLATDDFGEILEEE